jgi:hypothetical protein
VKRVGWVLFCIAVSLVACGTKPSTRPVPAGEDDLPARMVEIARPDFYAAWWREVEDCAGRKRNLRQVRWYTVLGPLIDWSPYPVAGLAYNKRGIVIIASDWLFDSYLVRHEMLHLIASPYTHDSSLSRGSCAHLVMCTGPCAGQ